MGKKLNNKVLRGEYKLKRLKNCLEKKKLYDA